MADALAITGPTASGKTSLSIHVARALEGEIVSMDSRQVYRGMDIGTAKPSAAERAAVPHHGLDLIEPSERYSAGRFGRDARQWLRTIRARGRVPLLVGGTGFFLRALMQPLFEEPPMERPRRRRLEQHLSGLPEARQRAWLERLDPGSARRLASGGGSQRVKRALEVALLTGRPLPWWHEHAPGEPGPALRVFVLEMPKEVLDARIRQRVDAMLRGGLLAEVRRLREAGYHEDDPGMSGVGYREILAHLRGDVSLEQASEEIARATRQYARRQRTWFRNQLPESAVRLDATEPTQQLVERIVTSWRTEEGVA